jgi:hypothetical protein
MPGLVQFDRPQRCWFWLFDYGVHRCAALACFTHTDAACTTPPRQAGRGAVLGTLVCLRPLAHVSRKLA